MGSCAVPRGDVSLTPQNSREEWELEVVLVSGVLSRKQDPKRSSCQREDDSITSLVLLHLAVPEGESRRCNRRWFFPLN